MLSNSKTVTINDLSLRLAWTASNNKSTNSSDVTFSVYLTSSKDLTSTNSYQFNIFYNDKSAGSTMKFNLKAGTETKIYTNTVNILHDIRGSLELNLSSSIVINDKLNSNNYKTITVTDNENVDRIDRSSVLNTTPNEIRLNKTNQLDVTQYDQNFRTTIKIEELNNTSNVWYPETTDSSPHQIIFSNSDQIAIMKLYNGYISNKALYIIINTYYDNTLLWSNTYSTVGNSANYSTSTSSDFTILDNVPYFITSDDNVTNVLTLDDSTGTEVTSTKAPSLSGHLELSQSEIDKFLAVLVGKSSDTFNLVVNSFIDDYMFYSYKSINYTVTSLMNASTTPLSFEGGTNPKLILTNEDSRIGFSYDYIFTIGSFTKSWLDRTASDSFTTDFNSDDINKIYQNTNKAITTVGSFELITYYNRIRIRNSVKVDASVSIHNADPILLSSFTWQDTNKDIIAITNDSTALIKNKSIVAISLPAGLASGTKYSTINTVKVALNGVETSYAYNDNGSLITEGLVNYDTINLSVTVIDSRGYSTTKSKTGIVTNYDEPSVSTSNVEHNSSSNELVDIKLQGQFDLLPIDGVNKNKILSIQYRSKKSDEPSWSSYYSIEFSNVTNLFLVSTQVSLDSTVNWMIELSISDKLTTKVLQFNLTTLTPLLFLDTKKRSIGINCYPSDNNSFEVNGNKLITNNQIEYTNSKVVPLSKNSDNTWSGTYPNGFTSSTCYASAILTSDGNTTKQVNYDVTFSTDKVSISTKDSISSAKILLSLLPN